MRNEGRGTLLLVDNTVTHFVQTEASKISLQAPELKKRPSQTLAPDDFFYIKRLHEKPNIQSSRDSNSPKPPGYYPVLAGP
jgi:hypothetical protein